MYACVRALRKETTLERTHPPHPPGDEPSPASSALAALAGVSAEAALTMVGLQMLTYRMSPVPLDPEWLARTLFPALPVSSTGDRVVLDVLALEEAGCVVTWAQDGREWVALAPAPARPTEAPPAAPHTHPAEHSEAPFSPAGEREREREQERRREHARARAREQMQEEEREQASRWEQQYSTTSRRRPERPARLQAPPIGCPDHPHGSTNECGPCGTAWERRKTFLEMHRYEEQLALFEESQWEGFDREPF